jgi:hypothetical protein
MRRKKKKGAKSERVEVRGELEDIYLSSLTAEIMEMIECPS